MRCRIGLAFAALSAFALTLLTPSCLDTAFAGSSPFVWNATCASGAFNLFEQACLSVTGTGTVVSVGLSLPGIFTVSGSPVTTTGTLTAALASQTANTFWAAPNGALGAPTFRLLVAADIPNLSASIITSGQSSASTSTTGVTVVGTNATLAPVTVDVQTATNSQPGLLSAADHTSFAGKQAAGSYITALTSDVSASGPGSASATVNSVGGASAANVASTVTTVAAATNANTASTLILRDGGGSFSAGVITEQGQSSNPSNPGSGYYAIYPNAAGHFQLQDTAGNLQEFYSQQIQWFGDGSDGAASISSGTTTITRDMYYSSLTITGTGRLNPAGYQIYVSGTCDLSAAPAGAISIVTTAGGNGAAGGAAGSAGNGLTGKTVGGASAGSAGGAGSATTGAQGTAGGSGNNGGTGGATLVGGTGSAGAGGAARGINGPVGTIPIRRITSNLISGVTLLAGGAAGGGGNGGGGDAAVSGGGGGGSGGAGGVIYLACDTVNRGGSTTAGAIAAMGSSGGNGGTPASGNSGGGSGGAGSGGGWVYLVVGSLTGSAATNAIDVTGGSGGTGGNGTGTGTGGGGGGSGSGGRVTILYPTTGTSTDTLFTNQAAGGAASGTTGGTGTTATTSRVSL